MLLRHKITGDVYSYHKVLADSGDYETYEEPKPVFVSEQPVIKKARKKSVAIPINGEPNGTDA